MGPFVLTLIRLTSNLVHAEGQMFCARKVDRIWELCRRCESGHLFLDYYQVLILYFTKSTLFHFLPRNFGMNLEGNRYGGGGGYRGKRAKGNHEGGLRRDLLTNTYCRISEEPL